MSAYPKNTFTRVNLLVPRGDTASPTYKMEVATSQTIKPFDLLILSSGKLTQAISLPGTNSTGAASGGSLSDLYVAMAPITTGASVDPAVDSLSVIKLKDAKDGLLLRIYNTTDTASQQQDVLAGTNYQVGRWRGASANEWWYYMSTVTTSGDVTLLEKSPESAAADYYGLVVVGQ